MKFVIVIYTVYYYFSLLPAFSALKFKWHENQCSIDFIDLLINLDFFFFQLLLDPRGVSLQRTSVADRILLFRSQ